MLPPAYSFLSQYSIFLKCILVKQKGIFVEQKSSPLRELFHSFRTTLFFDRFTIHDLVIFAIFAFFKFFGRITVPIND